ncbi:hypothetical protein HHK36_001187 [Tetracentron sinense]|uniref:POX domain-containing protein n=1 Tax=Tetracentron sinense TaxID=13715 RepID=A0A835A2D1_TETSI|nr:hypothetical protein HHK36_001187 [Tetracentron sinense]
MACESSEEKSRSLVSSAGFCYSDVLSSNPTIQTHLVNQMQSFESNPEIFGLTTDMEMLEVPSKNLQLNGFFSKPGNQGSSSSNMINESTSDFYQTEFSRPDFSTGFSETTSENLIVAPNSVWHENRLLIDNSSPRCVFPCEGNERPSQGLSLSLCSKKPSSIGLQSFELRETSHHHQHQQQNDIRFMSSNSRDGFFRKSANLHHYHQQQILQDNHSGKAANLDQTQFKLKNSKYLVPAQELLNHLCNLETKHSNPPKKKPHMTTNQSEDDNGSGSSRNQSLYSLELHELQKRKSKLLSMLEEVDRRYKNYCDQMKAMVTSFEKVAGTSAAVSYSALASKAMSRHFKCLRDGIVGQIQVIKKAMGEKDPVALGTTKGETPRLRLLDQTIRQQREFHQMSLMETHPWRPQRGLPEQSVSVLRAWLFEHFLNPYPSDVDKHILARQTGLSRSQACPHFSIIF